MEVIKIDTLKHRNKNCIALAFKFNSNIQLQIKKLDATWSATNKVWLIADTAENRNNLKLLLKDLATFETGPNIKKEIPKAITAALPISDETGNAIQKYAHWLKSRRYSASTVKTYSEAMQSFLKFYAHKTIGEITNNDVIVFNNEFILTHKLSASYQNQIVNAIKLFFVKMENKKIDVDLIHRPKREKLLPNVLSKDEVKAILNAHSNIKHKTMLSLIWPHPDPLQKRGRSKAFCF